MSVVKLASYKAVAPASATNRLPRPVDAPSACAPRRCSRRVTIDLVRALDTLAIMCGGLLPVLLHTRGTLAGLDVVGYVRAAVVAGLFSAVLLTMQGHYCAASLPRLPGRPFGLALAIAAALAAVVLLGLPAGPARADQLSWAAAWTFCAVTLVLGARSLSRGTIARLAARGRFARRIAIFGADAIGRRIHEQLSAQSQSSGITVVGLFDDRLPGERMPKEATIAVGRACDLADMARAGDIDDIIIAMPPTADRRIDELARRFEQLPANIRIATHIASDYVEDGHRPTVSTLCEVGLIDIKHKALADWDLVVKRAEDIVLACCLVVAAAPLVPLIALAIKLDSKGPVLFLQRRRGLNQRIINVLKFRTMSVLEDNNEVRQAVASDPRVTRVGRFLRRTSLDELPQLLNVIRGEMSLVGPRPHALVHDELYGALIETYANRHQVKPGITGLAQVRGHRGETQTTDKMQMRIDSDLAYIKTWSLGLDLKILLATVWTVATQKNAR